jgi:MoaA/NifB/PqqE/SkfB family radical SAM enzyme
LYYQLQNHCALVEGRARGAVYDFKEGKVLSINKSAAEFLLKCRNEKISDIIDADLPQNEKYLKFLDSLSAKGIGSFYSVRQEGGSIEEKERRFLENDCQNPPKLDFLWLELTNACNNRCLHCYSESSPVSSKNSLPHERWLSLITEAKNAGATAIQFIGGEPLLYPKWKSLALKACEENYGLIEIFTNATLITDDDIEFFKAHNISIATTIYADNSHVHDAVTLNSGSFTKTMDAVEKILAKGVALRVASVIMRANEDQAENVLALCQRLGVEGGPPDVVRPGGRGSNDDILPLFYQKPPIKPPFQTDEISFFQARKYHSCLCGKIAVTTSGDVIPCIFARGRVCANVAAVPLADALESILLKI